MAKQKIKYRIRKGGSNSGEKRKPTAAQKGKYLLIVALLSAGGFGLYQYFAPDKYEYWNQLIAKDPKPQGVSEAEYREKLRAGYCWRDRKFYQPEELHQKAMISFSEKLITEAAKYRHDETTNQGGHAYTSADCKRRKADCHVWVIPKDYTNEQWDKKFQTEIHPADKNLLTKFNAKKIQTSSELKSYLSNYNYEKFTLNQRFLNGQRVFGSNCCQVIPANKIEKDLINKPLVTSYIPEFGDLHLENHIPHEIHVKDYGVGNFYLKTNELVTELKGDLYGEDLTLEKKSYRKIGFGEFKNINPNIYFLNNCGDLLWKPYY